MFTKQNLNICPLVNISKICVWLVSWKFDQVKTGKETVYKIRNCF